MWDIIGISVIVLLLIILLFNEYCIENFGSDCLEFIPGLFNGKDMPSQPGTIFISVASYRDDECSDTINSIFENAKYPDRIAVGVCQQNKEGNEDCIKNTLRTVYINNIRTITLSYKEAKGPTYARYWCSTLWRGEEYFFQIDSHTQFVKDWDEIIVGMFKEIKTPQNKPILSAYPPTKDQMNIKGVPMMCHGKLSENKIPIFLASWTEETEVPKLSPKPFIAGGFMFLEGNFLREVPYDPTLSHVFQGEETLLSARLWTHGYDFYTPNKKIAWHHYGRKDKPKYWTDHSNSGDCRGKAEKRVLFLLGLENEKSVGKEFLRDIHKYGMGRVRKLEDFWKASGIDFSKKGTQGVTNKCK